MILFASYSEVLGGAERLLLEALGAVEGPRVLACPEGGLAAAAREAGVPVLAVPARPLDLRASPRAGAAHAAGLAAHARELRRLRVDLGASYVVAWGMRSALSCALARAPFAFHHNDVVPPELRGPVRWAAGRARVVVALSQTVADDLGLREAGDLRLRGAGDLRLREADDLGLREAGDLRLRGSGDIGVPARVILPGVDLDAFTPVPPVEEAHALVLGALVPWKRPDLALEIVALAARDIPQLRVTFAGEGIGAGADAFTATLHARAAEPDLAGRVDFRGRVGDPRALLREAAALLHAADREPFGIALAEALARSRPVVAPDAGGPREIVDDTCGRRYPPGDTAAGAAALVDVLTDPARFATAARTRAEDRFDARRMRTEYREVFTARPATGQASRAPATTTVQAPTHPGEGGGREVRPRSLAIVTVSHDSRDDLRRLVTSVAAHLPDARLVVVDSGSGDDSAAVARELGATVIELGENAGYGAATNRGLAEVAEEITVIANPDIELVDDSLADLAAGLAAHPAGLAAGGSGAERIVVPRVLLGDGRRQDVAQHEPGSLAEAVIAAVPPAALPRRVRARIQPWSSDRPARATWPVGACLVARTETLRALGPFDPEVFLFSEDLDLGLRAADAGVATWSDPRARVLHRQGHAGDREPLATLARRRHEAVAKRRGRAIAARDDVLQLATFANRTLLKTLARRDATRERGQLAAARSVAVLTRAIPPEARAPTIAVADRLDRRRAPAWLQAAALSAHERDPAARDALLRRAGHPPAERTRIAALLADLPPITTAAPDDWAARAAQLSPDASATP